MPEVRSVLAQIRPANPGDTGQITTGYYVVDGDQLVMTHPDGQPVDEFRYRHTMRSNDREQTIAAIFTKQIRTEMLGEIVPGFTRSLSYPKQGLA